MAAVRLPRPPWTAPSGRDSPSCRIPTTRAAMTSLCAFKANLALRGVPHASICALPVHNLRSALCEQNTLRRPRRVSHTRPPGEPIRSESIYQPSFCPSAGSATSTAYVSGPGFTPASAHAAASCAAWPEPRARRRANPARFPIQLRPLLGLCPSVAVVVSIQPTHSCMSRRSHTMS